VFDQSLLQIGSVPSAAIAQLGPSASANAAVCLREEMFYAARVLRKPIQVLPGAASAMIASIDAKVPYGRTPTGTA
jgi:hypothetical protein